MVRDIPVTHPQRSGPQYLKIFLPRFIYYATKDLRSIQYTMRNIHHAASIACSLKGEEPVRQVKAAGSTR